MRRLALLALALAGCPSPSPPGGFGVNVTVDGTQISDGARNAIASARLSVTGDMPNPYTVTLDAIPALHSGTVRFRYDPAVHAGTLVFSVDAFDGSNALVAHGDSDPTALADGQTATATIRLAEPGGNDLGAPDLGSVDLAGADLTTGPDLFMPQPNGAACTADTDCKNGHCADGVCCDTACKDACHACNIGTLKGTCSPVASGSAPAMGHPSCGPDPASSCMRDGSCDGAGACRLYVGGTMCGAASCNSTTNMLTAQSTCDGAGHCVAGVTGTCAPYVCQSATACYTSCSGASTGCVSGKVCVGGSCGLKSNGASCTSGSECSSGFCVDGVCCNSACTQSCYSCNQAASLGMCKPAPANTDPRNNCPAGSGANSVCAPGKCNGSGACNQATGGTVCQNPSCANGTLTNQGTCSGAVCNPGSTVSCSPYVCSGTLACATSCSTMSDCVLGDVCNGTVCQNCQLSGSSATVYVDPVNGTDDTLHGGGGGKCAVRSIHYALNRTTGNVCAQATGSFNTEPYPLPLGPGQTLNCNCEGIGMAQIGNGTNDAITINGSNVQVLNCEVYAAMTGSSKCISVIPTGTSGINITGNKIHDCTFGVAVNGAVATINNNTFQNFTNGLNGLGTDTVMSNSFYCSGGGDAINGCSGTSVLGSGNYCSGCTVGCNACSGMPSCYQLTQMFWTVNSTCM